jgi:uncharacterized protein YkwD
MNEGFKGQLLIVITILASIPVLISCQGAHDRYSSEHAAERAYARQSQPRIGIHELEKNIHALINKERTKHGLSALAWDDTLGRISRKHSQDMAKRNYFSHDSPEGHDFSYRYRQDGYSCAVRWQSVIYTGAENIFQNNLYDSITTINGVRYYDWNSEGKIAETTVEGWMNSSGHRKNILTPHWKKEGIGVAIATGGRIYVTENFC